MTGRFISTRIYADPSTCCKLLKQWCQLMKMETLIILTYENEMPFVLVDKNRLLCD